MTAGYFQVLPVLLLILRLSAKFLISDATSHHGRVLGGSLTDFEEFPFIAYVKSSDSVSFCTGALLSLQHILIPSNCITNTTGTAGLSVVVGTNDPTWNEFSCQRFETSDQVAIVPHPTLGISIITLPQEFLETTAVKEISVAGSYVPHDDYLIVGYPDIYRNSVAPSDGEIRLTKITTNGNNSTYCTEQSVSASQLCTGMIHGGFGACATNGGILTRRSDGIDAIYGIIDNQCCGAPRCFDTFWDLTNPSVNSWIQDMIEQASSEEPEPFVDVD